MAHAPKIELKDPADLRVHPLKKQLPRALSWQKGGDDFNVILEDIRERGIIAPLLVNSMGEILDGEVRWIVAKVLHLEVPTLELVCPEAASVILGSLLQRQHLTKSALAYLAYPLMAKAHQEANSRHLERLRTGNKATIAHGVRNGRTVADLAAEMGICRRVFEYASRLHASFTKNPDLRIAWEPKILAGEIALGAALAGIAGADATAGKAKTNRDQLLLFTDGLETVGTRFAYWQKFDDVTKQAAREKVREFVAEMPDEILAEFEAAIRIAKRDGRKAA